MVSNEFSRRSVLRLRGSGDDDTSAEASRLKELGNQAYKDKKFAEALEHYEKASSLDPTSIVYLNNMAAAHFGMNKFDECVAQCKKAIEIGRSNRADFKDLAKAYARMANAQVKLGELAAAVEAYDKSLMEHRDPQVELKKRDCVRLKERMEEEAYLDPVKAEEERQRGNAFFKEGKWVEAIKAYSEGLRRDPKNHLIYSNRAQTYLKVLDFGSALRDCDKCIELQPDFPRAYARKATVQLLCKQTHKAKETVEKGLKIAPADPELLDVSRKVQASVMGVGLSKEEREARAQEAMKDPSIVALMQDPVLRDVLNDMQTNPAAAQKHMQDPIIAKKIETLVAAGIIQMR